MTIEAQLKELGFDEKEGLVYLAALQLGQDTAFNIAKKSGLKRSTAYFVLANLIKKGLVSLKQTRTTTFYSASNPNKLSTQLKHKEKILEELLPTLLSVYNYNPKKPSINVYEGREGLRQIYVEIIEFLKKGKEILCYGDLDHISEIDDITESWIKQSDNKKYKIREILNYREQKKEYVQLMNKSKNPNHQIRFFPEELQMQNNDNIIYGNKLAIISTREDIFTTLIESGFIADSYRSFFELAWKSARNGNN